MNGNPFLRPPPLYLEISSSTLTGHCQGATRDWPLERGQGGRLTDACGRRLERELATFAPRRSWQPRRLAWCALDGRGVVLRRLRLPPATSEETRRLLLLQIENEFPLSPDELAWGYFRLPEDRPPSEGTPPPQELLVAAVRKEVTNDYHRLLSASGFIPSFTFAALTRSTLIPRRDESHALLHLGRSRSELLCLDGQGPLSLRLIDWGSKLFLEQLARDRGLRAEDIDTLQRQLEAPTRAPGPAEERVSRVIRAAAESLVNTLSGLAMGRRLYLMGTAASWPGLASRVAEHFGGALACETVPVHEPSAPSPALVGLRQSVEGGGGAPVLVVRAKPGGARSTDRPAAPMKWALAAGALAAACVLVRYGEPWLMKPGLASKLTALKAGQGRLATIDRELEFLRHLRQNQTPALDVLTVLATAAPTGARLELISLNRRGELSLRATIRTPQEAVGFRSKLVASGLFANLVVEEQSPNQNRDRIMLRMTAQCQFPAGLDARVLALAQEPATPPSTPAPASPSLPPVPPLDAGSAPPSPPPGAPLRPPGAAPTP